MVRDVVFIPAARVFPFFPQTGTNPPDARGLLRSEHKGPSRARRGDGAAGSERREGSAERRRSSERSNNRLASSSNRLASSGKGDSSEAEFARGEARQ